jgi:hypothetical protein
MRNEQDDALDRIQAKARELTDKVESSLPGCLVSRLQKASG